MCAMLSIQWWMVNGEWWTVSAWCEGTLLANQTLNWTLNIKYMYFDVDLFHFPYFHYITLHYIIIMIVTAFCFSIEA